MKQIVIFIMLSIVSKVGAVANEQCACKQIEIGDSMNLDESSAWQAVQWNFSETFTTESVRGLVSASYYYCNDEHGILVVNRHDKSVVHKDVPLKNWFELRFSDSAERYYRKHIKYQYIIASSSAASPKLGDYSSYKYVQ